MFERLRALRKEKGLTCEDMAEVLGLETKSAYSKKENGSTKFSLDDAKKVSSILNKSIEDIFFADEVSLKDTKKLELFPSPCGDYGSYLLISRYRAI